MTAKELKASILQLAVTGKLVPQDPNDEPASVLLERIKAEKAKLVKAGKIKKDKNPSEIVVGSDGAVYEKFKDGSAKYISDDIPFEIPKGWSWVRLENFGSYHGGHTPSMSDSTLWGGHIPWVSSKDMKRDVIDDTQDKITEKGAKTLQIVKVDSLVFVTRSGILKHTFPVAIVQTPCTINQDLKALIPFTPQVSQYLALCLRALQGEILKRYRKKGMTVQSIIWDSFIKMPVPLPPLSEQKRIVTKIEQLMPLVEKYGEMEEQRLRLDANLPTALEKSILQEAIQGKLVPQDPNDEPASELLKRVAAERKALIKAGKLKRDKGESVVFRGSDRLAYETRNGETVCVQDEIPFDIPDSWEWVRLGSVIALLSGRDLEPCEYSASPKKFPYMTGASNFVNGKLIVNRWTDKSATISHCGDLLITCKGTIGAMAFNTIGNIHIARQIMAISSRWVSLEYVKVFLESIVLSLKCAANSMIPGIDRNTMLSLLVPLPPLAEQKRIAKKVEEMKVKIRTLVNF